MNKIHDLTAVVELDVIRDFVSFFIRKILINKIYGYAVVLEFRDDFYGDFIVY